MRAPGGKEAAVRRSAALLLVLVLAGCGGGEEGKVREVMQRHAEALAEGDGERACRDLTAEARRLVVVSVDAVAPGLGARTCEQALRAIGGRLDDEAKRQLRDAHYEVELHGDGTATADPDTVSGEAQLRKRGGRWVITRLNFGS